MKGKVLLALLLLWPVSAGANSLAQVAADIQRIEGRLIALEARVDQLKEHGVQLEAEYAQSQEKMAKTLSAMVRLQSVPKEAVLVRPGGPLQAARTTMVLKTVLPAIERDSQHLRRLWHDLSQNRDQLTLQTSQARDAKNALIAAHDELHKSMRVRTGVQDEAVNALAAKAEDLRDLLIQLQDEQMGGVQFIPQEHVQMREGNGVLPVSGVVKTRYGGNENGVRIGTLDGALVVAPMDGIVKYAGPFKGYGHIVIIAHKGGYHSLLSGLSRVDVDVGQNLGMGEPVGLVSAAKDGQNQASLYFELRLNGQAVNPARKIPDLG